MNENENKETTLTTFTEAIVTGWQHPIMGSTYVNRYEFICGAVGGIKMGLTAVGIFGIIFLCIFNKMADDQTVQIKDAETGKWCFWNKALKKWLPKD